MSVFKRRACVGRAGEPLLLPLVARSEEHQPGDMAMHVVRRQLEWIDLVTYPDGSLDAAVASRFLRFQTVLVPLPIYTDAPGRQFEHINPEMLWHPLFWLPNRLAGRYQLMDEDGASLGVEDEESWAVRVMLEMSVSGLYDAESGTWLDVLARVGIDVDDRVDIARIEAWQSGAADSVLDSIDLSADLDMPSDPDWALSTAQALMDDLVPASWALTADDLAALCTEVSDLNAQLEPGVAHQVIMTVVGFARALLADVPWPIDEGESREFWDSQASALSKVAATATLDPVVSSIASAVSDRLYAVREHYWPHLDWLGEMVGGAEPDPEPGWDLASA